jgi:hypothetical protein
MDVSQFGKFCGGSVEVPLAATNAFVAAPEAFSTVPVGEA